MEVTVADHEQFQKKIDVKVPYEALSDKINAKYEKYKKSVQLEGFRKGKVPLSLLKKVFGKQIEAEAVEEAIPDFLQKAIDQEKVKFYDMVSVNEVNFDQKNGLSFSAIVKVEPEVELQKYKDLEFEKEIYQVSDEDVQEALDNLREQYATMSTVEDAAQDGHFIVADLQKTDETGHPLIGEKFDNRYLQLQTTEDGDEIVEQLLGVKAGETRQVKVTSEAESGVEPEQDYFSVSVKEVKEKIIPELDDEFAKDMGEDSVEALKKSVREHLEKQALENDNKKFEDVIIDKIIKENPIDIPEFMIEGYLNDLVKEFQKQNPNNTSAADVKKEFRGEAIRNLKWWMIRDKIAELEEVKVEEEEIAEHIEELAKNAGKDAPKVRREYRSEKMHRQVWQELFHKKIIDAIVNNSKVVEKTVTREDLKKRAEMAEAIAGESI